MAVPMRCKRAKEKSSAQHVVPNQKNVRSDDRDCLKEDAITLLRQQLASRTEECHELRLKLESIKETNARILTNQLEMQGIFVKVANLFAYCTLFPHIHKLAHKK